MLPETIADKLRENPDQPIADRFDEATVMFADLVGFTKLSRKMFPEDLVSLLNEIFSAFDTVGSNYGTEKIKTIGDACMAVSGLPEPCEDHANRIIQMAKGFQIEFEKVVKRRKLNLAMRIGIASGPVTAGVIGKAKFAYDVWSATVNLASRLESNGEPGRIHVSQEVYRALKDNYRLEKAAPKILKGVGRVQSWYLVQNT